MTSEKEEIFNRRIIITNLNPKKIKVKSRFDFKKRLFRIEVKLKEKEK